MSNNAPTLINLPPPPSDPTTPDVPSRSGTPNSTTTSMSELSTVAIKDGHRGHLPHHHSSNPLHDLNAERADRISRLAGLERVATARPSSSSLSANQSMQPPPPAMAQSYFDATGNPAMGRERSTVGSASATGSVGARTTWAGSEAEDLDKMSESQDNEMDLDASSVGGMSAEEQDERGSLVGFGEGARTPARGSVVGGSVAGSTVGSLVGAKGRVEGLREVRMGGEGGGGVTEKVREGMNTTSADRMEAHGEELAGPE